MQESYTDRSSTIITGQGENPNESMYLGVVVADDNNTEKERVCKRRLK